MVTVVLLATAVVQTWATLKFGRATFTGRMKTFRTGSTTPTASMVTGEWAGDTSEDGPAPLMNSSCPVSRSSQSSCHPLYQTSNQTYGSRRPSVHEMPVNPMWHSTSSYQNPHKVRVLVCRDKITYKPVTVVRDSRISRWRFPGNRDKRSFVGNEVDKLFSRLLLTRPPYYLRDYGFRDHRETFSIGMHQFRKTVKENRSSGHVFPVPSNYMSTYRQGGFSTSSRHHRNNQTS